MEYISIEEQKISVNADDEVRDQAEPMVLIRRRTGFRADVREINK
jgi:hypothetical protein